VCDIQPTEQQEKNGSQNSKTGCCDYQELAQQITQLKEAVSVLESRLSNQSTHYEGLIMRHILARFKSILRQLETINPYQYDGLVMQCLGGF
jgi:hypothetical protein